MPFKRDCVSVPVIYDQWVDHGAKWTVQDLAPEDDEEALRLFTEVFINDEILSITTGLSKDPISHEACRKFWREMVIPQRMTLACYREKDGERRIAGLNGLVVKCRNDPPFSIDMIEGDAWRPVAGCLSWVASIQNLFDVMKVDQYLSGAGILVLKEFRGCGIGVRLLNARGPLCKQFGIKATATVFSGEASPKVAAKCGFTTLLEVTFSELADAGLQYPRVDTKVVLMYKIFD